MSEGSSLPRAAARETIDLTRSIPPYPPIFADRMAATLASLHALPPVTRPGKMFYAAQNFQEHVDEMIRAGMTPATGPRFTGEKSTTRPYLFLKAPSCLAGAHDEHADIATIQPKRHNATRATRERGAGSLVEYSAFDHAAMLAKDALS
jgi:2-keto-4-pentenoate hydratase/2-oxohepta-3-ene-1,7-dioic acid hydratase in catechol pathway